MLDSFILRHSSWHDLDEIEEEPSTSISISLSLFMYLYICMYVYIYIYICPFLSWYPSIYVSIIARAPWWAARRSPPRSVRRWLFFVAWAPAVAGSPVPCEGLRALGRLRDPRNSLHCTSERKTKHHLPRSARRWPACCRSRRGNKLWHKLTGFKTRSGQMGFSQKGQQSSHDAIFVFECTHFATCYHSLLHICHSL